MNPTSPSAHPVASDSPGPTTAVNWSQAIPWALYDWANSAYATTVLATLFPIFLKEFWVPAGTPANVSTSWLGNANSTAGLITAALAPVLGAIADRGGARKKFLLFFATLGVVMTGALFFVAQGQWPIALGMYVLATLGFNGGNLFYDSLLVSVAGEKKLDVVSALGYSLGYLGGGALFLFNVYLVGHPGTFGLADAAEAIRWAFVSVAVWWGVFSLPILLWVKEPPASARPAAGESVVRAGFAQLGRTFREIRRLRPVLLFLVAYWLYIDGVDTIVLMATDYGLSRGFTRQDLIQALLLTQFVAFPAALVFGKLGEKLGPKRGILIALVVYLGVTVWGFFMNDRREFYMLAGVIGLVQGGVQSLSRSLYARLIPPDKAGEFFGFYNMLGKFAAVIGPALMGNVGLLVGDTRYSILALAVLFIAGGTLLVFVRVEKRANLRGPAGADAAAPDEKGR